MTHIKPLILDEDFDNFAPQGANDARWFFVGHHLIQVKLSIEAVQKILEEIVDRPENVREGYLADDCLDFVREARADFLAHCSGLLDCLFAGDVPERILRKEL